MHRLHHNLSHLFLVCLIFILPQGLLLVSYEVQQVEEINGVKVLVEEDCESPHDGKDRGRESSNFRQDVHDIVNISCMLHSFVVNEEVKAHYQIISGVNEGLTGIGGDSFYLSVSARVPERILFKIEIVKLVWSLPGYDVIVSIHVVELNKVIVVSVLETVQLELRVKLVVYRDGPFTDILDLPKSDALFKDVHGEVY